MNLQDAHTPRERELYLAGVQNGLDLATRRPDLAPRAREIADLELLTR